MANMLQVGDRVQVVGLSSEKGRALNGQLGRVVTPCCPESYRYGVVVGEAPAVKIKEFNLILHLDRQAVLGELPYRLRPCPRHGKLDANSQQRLGKISNTDIPAIKKMVSQVHRRNDTFGCSDHHILYMHHQRQMLMGFILPDDLKLWTSELESFRQKFDYDVFPKNDRLMFKCESEGKLFAVFYHNFGGAFLPFGTNQQLHQLSEGNFYGPALALALTNDVLPMKPRWISKSAYVYAELKLIACGMCGSSAKASCSICRTICYCCVQCQEKDWKRHKPFCRKPDVDSSEEKTTHTCLVRSCLSELASAHALSHWKLLTAKLESLSIEVARDVYLGIMASQTILQNMSACISDARLLKSSTACSMCIKLMKNMFDFIGPSARIALSQQHSIFIELVELLLLLNTTDPFGEITQEIWSLLLPLREPQSIVDSKLPQLFLATLKVIVSSFATLEAQFENTFEWLYPMTAWGLFVFDRDTNFQLQVISPSENCITNEIVDYLSRVLDLLAWSKIVRIVPGSELQSGLDCTIQGLRTCCQDERLATRIPNEVKARLQRNWLVEASELAFQVLPKKWSNITTKRDRACVVCQSFAAKPFLCPNCRIATYCSAHCYESHRPLHEQVCSNRNADPDVDEISGASKDLAEAILQNKTKPITVHVLEFSRSPQSFLECLNNNDGLRECRQALEGSGFSSDLPSGGKVYVHPHEIEGVMDALDKEAFDIKPRHVIANELFEEDVMRAVASLRCNDKVKKKSKKALVVPHSRNMDSGFKPYSDQGESSCNSNAKGTDFQQEAAGPDVEKQSEVVPYLIKRTFLHVSVPSSLWSGPSSGAKTVSTLDAGSRSGMNPRTKRGTRS